MDRILAMRAFVLAADAESFTVAALRLEISPQAVSKLISALESQLGSRLLRRTTRRMSLTEEGAAYLEGARAILADLDGLENDVRARGTDPAGLVRLAAPTTFGHLHLMAPIATFLDSHPKISMRMDLADRSVDLVEEAYDLAVRIGAPGPDSSNLVRRFGVARRVLCASPAHLARRGHPAKPEDLADHSAVLDLNHARSDRWTLKRGEETRHVKVSGRIQVNSADATRVAALAGLGVLLAPTFAVGDDLREGRLVRVLPEWSAEPLDLQAIFPPGKGLAPKVRLLVDHLARCFGSKPPWDEGLNFQDGSS